MDEAQTLCDRIAILDHGEIIAQDTPAGSIGLLGASATIECELTPAVAAGGAARAARRRRTPAAASSASCSTPRPSKTPWSPCSTPTSLRGAKVDHLQVHAPTLEDVFLKLTGRALRE